MVDVGSAKLRQNTRDARGFFGLFGTFRCWDTRRVLAEMACEGNPSAALDSVLYLAVSMYAYRVLAVRHILRIQGTLQTITHSGCTPHAASGCCVRCLSLSGWIIRLAGDGPIAQQGSTRLELSPRTLGQVSDIIDATASRIE